MATLENTAAQQETQTKASDAEHTQSHFKAHARQVFHSMEVIHRVLDQHQPTL